MAATEQVAQRLYYDSAALEFEAVVTDIRLVSRDASRMEGQQLWQVSLDRTAFYPEGGGQPWDTGVLVAVARSGATLEVAVERVEEDEAGEVWHFVRKPLVAGTEVTGKVDAARRVDHEQQHSGQHLLSAMFLRELGARTVSFHMGVESSTIDVALAAGAERLSEGELLRVEAAANVVVSEGRPLMSHWIEREMADLMLSRGDLQKLPPREGRLRIVQMQGIEFNACGGTHVANTGAIGAVTLRRLEKVKQGWRIEFCCGLRAVRAARQDFLRLGEVAGVLSVGVADAAARVQSLLAEGKEAAKERKALMEELAGAEARVLAEKQADGVVRAVFAGKEMEFAKRVGSKLAGLGRTAALGATQGIDGAVVASRAAGGSVDCGKVLREALHAVGARGGGSAEMAQGVCAAELVEGLVERLAAELGRG